MKITGISTIGPVVRNHISSRMAERSIAIQRKYVPIVVPGLSTSSSSSSSPTSPTSSSQEAVTPTQHPASTGSESESDVLRGNPSRGPAETENTNDNDNEEGGGDSSHDLTEWIEEFKENLVDESVPEHRDASSSSHELPSEPRAKVVSGKHSIFTHYPKDRNCDICMSTKSGTF